MLRIRSHFAIEEKIALKNLPIKRKKRKKTNRMYKTNRMVFNPQASVNL